MLRRCMCTLLLCFVALAQPPPILDYIKQTWRVLTRSNQDLASAAPDPKFRPAADGRWPVYVSRSADLPEKAVDLPNIEIRKLPEDPAQVRDQGLLYLPRPYVVPGGRFNEMYGWDSYFIQVGLLRDGELELAKDMADNALYEIREYGKILNANRTYYLTRSQPPFLTEMLLGVYGRTRDRKWLEDAVPAIDKYHHYWTSEPHSTPETGLSRYFDLGDGPAPEVVAAERDAQGRTHYELVREYFRTHHVPDYDVRQYYDRKTDQLTPLFYKGDRSMRESGFDPSNRFGPFSRWQTTTGNHFLAMMGAAAHAKGESHEAYSGNLNRGTLRLALFVVTLGNRDGRGSGGSNRRQTPQPSAGCGRSRRRP